MKKIVITILIIIILIAIGVFCYFNFSTERGNNVENVTEIQPEEEISDEQMRETNIKLYFVDSTSGILTQESRLIDAKELITNPYLYVVNLVLQGPKLDNLTNPIPQGTKVNSVELKKGIAYIDLSEEFLNSKGSDSIYAIVNSLTEFNEVESVKFTINGTTKDGLKEAFVRKQ